MKVSVLIPAYNEEKNIEHTIKGIYNIEPFFNKNGLNMEILVIDDGSFDQTAKMAKKAGAQVLKLEHNTGKGHALKEGLKKSGGDIIVFLDADLQESSSEMYKLLCPILENKADVVIAKFKNSNKKKGFGFVKKLAFFGVKIFTGMEYTSALSGQRAFKREVLDAVADIPSGFGIEVGMLIDILRRGFKVVEVDVDMYHDVTGRDLKGFLHRGKQFWHILKTLLSKSVKSPI